MLVEPGSAGLNDELAEFGAVETLNRARNGHSHLRISAGAADSRYRGCGPCPPGTRLVLRGDADYPTQLEDLDEPPLALWIRGELDLRLSATRSVAIVGARAASGYGQRVAHELGLQLASREWAVVSGAAFGIDAAAHRGALNAPGPTIAVLACGVDISYPRSHAHLIAAIAERGAVITELPPGSAPLKFRFLARNRIIAALTRGCVIVEAASRSGAVSTANRALELARPLMAVPGPVDVVTSSGTNRMLHDTSARLVRDAQDVIEVILGTPQHDASTLELPVEAQDVACALRASPSSVSAIAAATRLEPDLVVAMLGLLELMGRATRSERGWSLP
jgi:DNA processing protein